MKRRNFINLGFCSLLGVPVGSTRFQFKSYHSRSPITLAYVKGSALMTSLCRIKFHEFQPKQHPETLALDTNYYPLIWANTQLNQAQPAQNSDFRIRLQASVPPPTLRQKKRFQLLTASIDVAFQPYHDVLYHAWHYDCLTPQGSSPVTFTSSIHQDYGFNFSITTKMKIGEELVTQNTPICLSPNPALSPFGLHPGIYVIMFHDLGYWNIPKINRYAVIKTKPEPSSKAAPGALSLIDATNQSTVDFPYIVMCIDHAEEFITGAVV